VRLLRVLLVVIPDLAPTAALAIEVDAHAWAEVGVGVAPARCYVSIIPEVIKAGR
jgi:hypothetical protein